MDASPAEANHVWPNWAAELQRALAFQSQFIISGNIRDLYIVPTESGPRTFAIVDALWELARSRAYEFMIVYDPIDGARVIPPESAAAAEEATKLGQDGRGLQFDPKTGRARTQPSLQALAGFIAALTGARNAAGLFVIDYASRIVARPNELAEDQRAFFAACEKIAHQTRQLRGQRSNGAPPFNPVIWLVNRPNDIPDWFIVGNETVRSLHATLPDLAARRAAAASLAREFADYDGLGQARAAELVDQYALLTDGLTVRSIRSIAQLVREREFGFERIGDAIRAYKVGAPDDPWKDPTVRERLRQGEERLGRRVKGQRQAKRAALDILTRSVMGLSGAQASRAGGRPRGVLFFAGPTGVGKTELAKALTELLFGDESAYHRYDMSEFSAEHAEARLIGAPPGFVGFDAGGELVNAVRNKPFCVILFDEIEKAHPRILDKFLQILEDGRLTDGRGETVFFSEAVIIFTSNLGIVVEHDGVSEQLVHPGDDYDRVKAKVLEAIRNHFRLKLQRPELLNRIGDNVVVFNFIEPAVGREIFSKMFGSILARLDEEQGVTLIVEPLVRSSLESHCLGDPMDGGRGIGNRLETAFINPLARALFERDAHPGDKLTVVALGESDGVWTVGLQ